MEIDVVARSVDGRALLVAEAEWGRTKDPRRGFQEIERKAANLPIAKGLEVSLAWFTKSLPRRSRDPRVFSPAEVLAVLR